VIFRWKFENNSYLKGMHMVRTMPIPIKITFTIPMTKNLLASEANLREHWTKRHARHNVQQFLLDSHMNRYVFFVPSKENNEIGGYFDCYEPEDWLPCIITLTRIAPRALDRDNLPYSLKKITDVICDNLIPGLAPGRADGDKRIKDIIYKQEKGRVREYALKVEIERII
jgi:hypothetical protein